MISSLLTSTSDIATRMSEAELEQGVFADHTRGAVHQGCLHALAALIERARHEMSAKVGSSPELIVTGGAVAGLLPLIETPYEQIDDLVLRGLALVGMERLRIEDSDRGHD
jgi:type III pantothenate kinase